ncbi:16412_t:CDS:2 [Cetraspora pellucida]|uniref:16412_t:CDS:1 n=1 Tax=Cetraspora pellucida TaxID=1433469 RepID=A0A9N9CH09_9GLOM|nr:16412_t:CDS:2 [Cetraspora pellucida]
MSQSPPSEVLQEIFKYLEDDSYYLHSCVLVNRIWSANAVQLLWNKPFHLLLNKKFNSSHYLISTYLSCLDPDEICSLDLHSILQQNSSSSKNFLPTFNYPSFLRHFAYLSMIVSVQEWCVINNLYVGDGSPIMQKIMLALFRLFAKHSMGLESFSFVMDMDVNINHGLSYYDNKLQHKILILREPIIRQWLGQIKEFEFAGDFATDKDFPFLMQICRHLIKMEVRLPDFGYNDDDEHYDSSAELTARFIESQNKLEHFILRDCHYPQALGTALIRQQNTLRYIQFCDIVFDKWCPLDWLPKCFNLEILEFCDSESLSSKVLAPLKLAPLTKLQSITFKEDPVPVDTLESLILASNLNLKEIIFGWPEDCKQDGYAHILNSISLNCPNLVRLGAMIGPNEIDELFGILKSCRKLKYLHIYGNGRPFDVSDILPELGKIMPRTLIYLNISARWRFMPDSLKQFLENCSLLIEEQHEVFKDGVPLKNFVINICDFINDEHLRILVRHSMKSLKFFSLWNMKFMVSEAGIDKASQWLRKSVV